MLKRFYLDRSGVQIALIVVIALLFIVLKVLRPLYAPSIIGSKEYLHSVQEDLKERQEAMEFSPLLDVISSCRTNKERDALTFLYAYMPVGDLADYPPKLFLEGVQHSIKVKKSMAWGKTVPAEIFRHFVLPLRVNNENLDESRPLFYEELKGRVEEMSMYDAVIEVNRWCQEKVVYTPSDARTSSPLATIKNAYGRCGEESVLTVAALRSIGIPARQVYTPRWAHTDSNHAWVEVWVDGEWYYLGACEPEPKLNIGWFSSTAKRALLMHAKVFGNYQVGEKLGNQTGKKGKQKMVEEQVEIIEKNRVFTEINVTANYAPVGKVVIKVVDEEGAAVEGATLHYKIFNYALLTTVATATTDSDGMAEMSFGMGDLTVLAYKGEQFAYKVIRASKEEQLEEIVLERRVGERFENFGELIPPAEEIVEFEVTEEERAYNDFRMAKGDSIRGVYTATFSKETPLLEKSRGNHKEISLFLGWLKEREEVEGRAYTTFGKNILSLISEKDLRDTPFEVLKNHVESFDQEWKLVPGYLNNPNIINPRIGGELLSTWRSYLRKEYEGRGFEGNPKAIISYLKSFKDYSSYNPQEIPITPIGIDKLKGGDKKGVEGLFIALCRSFGVAARFNGVTAVAQYRDGGVWHNYHWVAEEESKLKRSGVDALTVDETPIVDLSESAKLKIVYGGAPVNSPQYNSHYSLSKLDLEGEMSGGNRLSLTNPLNSTLLLEPGYYLLTAGNRTATGKVLTHYTFIELLPGSDEVVELKLREDREQLMVLGSFDAESRYWDIEEGRELSLLERGGRGFFTLLLMRKNHEPSTHLFRDLEKHGEELHHWGRALFLLLDQESSDGVAPFKLHPSFIIGVDREQAIAKGLAAALKFPTQAELPLIVVADSFGRIVWYRQGYSVGAGETLVSIQAETQR